MFYSSCENVNGHHTEACNAIKSKGCWEKFWDIKSDKLAALDFLCNQKGGEPLAAFEVVTIWCPVTYLDFTFAQSSAVSAVVLPQTDL